MLCIQMDVINDLPLSLSKILESEDEHGYLRPSSTEEDSLTNSMCSDYVEPDCFIPPAQTDNHTSSTNKSGNHSTTCIRCSYVGAVYHAEDNHH